MGRGCLIDTHALLWAADDTRQLSTGAASLLADPDTRVYVSIATLWEMAIKASVGKLDIPREFFREVYASGYLKLTIEIEHLERYRALPLHHRDPFDRLLVAQAQTEGLRLISHDPALSRYDVEVLW